MTSLLRTCYPDAIDERRMGTCRTVASEAEARADNRIEAFITRWAGSGAAAWSPPAIPKPASRRAALTRAAGPLHPLEPGAEKQASPRQNGPARVSASRRRFPKVRQKEEFRRDEVNA